MTERIDTRIDPPDDVERYWDRSRITLVALIFIVAFGAGPLAHSYLAITGVISEPDTVDDFACLSCHAANRGHIVPPDRSCLSCHPMDFDRHLSSARGELRLERIDAPFWMLIVAFGAFCIAALLFILKPSSPRRVIFVIAAGLLLGGVVAAAFGSIS